MHSRTALRGNTQRPIPVSEVMHTNVVTVNPETPTLDAIRLMKEHRIACLPVVVAAANAGRCAKDA